MIDNSHQFFDLADEIEAAEDDEVFRIIPENEYVEELEKEVKLYLQQAYIFEKNTKKYTPVTPQPNQNKEQFKEWVKEQRRRCLEGYDGLSGKMYFYINFCKIISLRGAIHPEFRVCDAEWFKLVDACQKSKKWGIVCVKRRRVGASWKEGADALHDLIFRKNFHIGMNSKTDRDSQLLFDKVKYLYDNLPDFLRVRTLSSTQNYLEFARWDKSVTPRRKAGNRSDVIAAAPTDSAFEGRLLNKWICDEAGKIGNLEQLYAYTEPCLFQETIRAGMPIIFGTSGDVGHEGKELKKMWQHASIYKFKRFFFSGYMGLYTDEYGNDQIEHCIRWIVYTRHEKSKLGNKALSDFIQQYPLTVSEAFNQASAGGVGDIIRLNKQKASLMIDPPERTIGRFRRNTEGTVEWVPDPRASGILYAQPQSRSRNRYVAGCLPAGEKVLTDSGLKNIETIGPNDKLVSKDGDYVNIKEFQIYDVDEPLYEFKIKNTLRTTKFTGEHPIYVSDNKKGYTSFKKKKREGLKYSHQKFDFNFKSAKDINVNEWIKYPNVYKKEKDVKFQFDFMNDPEFWWFLGVWLGDGSNDRGQFYISCNISEEKHIERLLGYIHDKLDRTPGIDFKKSNCVDIRFNHKELSDFFHSNFGRYSHGKNIPEWCKYLPKKYKLSLIAGYIDSDGCITKDKRRGQYSMEIVSINLEIMEHIQDILFSLGVVSSTSKLRDKKETYIAGRLVQQKPAYRVRAGNYWLKKLKDLGCQSTKLLVADIKSSSLNKHGCQFDENEDYIYFQIKEIKTSWMKGTVYNFHCDTSTYICRHITSHNCDPADHDDAYDEASDLSLYIMSKPSGLEPPQIVFEYTDRPRNVDEYYEQALMALEYYNDTKVLIERNRYGMIKHFDTVGKKYLLQRTPTTVTRLFGGKATTIGLYMTPAVKEYLKELISLYVKDYCEFIQSEELIDEFIAFGSRNTDKAMAFGITLIMLKEEEKTIPTTTSELVRRLPTYKYIKENGVIKRVSIRN